MQHPLFKSVLFIFTLSFLVSCFESVKPDLESEEGIRSALNQNPVDPEALHARAKLFLKTQKADSAVYDMLLALEQDSSKAEYFVTLADAYLVINQTRYTRNALEKAIRLDPENKDAHMKLAELYLYVEMRQDAINEINEVLKRDKTNPKAYYLKGIIYKESGDTALAISSFMTTVEQDPKYLSAYEQLGLVFASAHNPRAVDYYNTAIRLNPNNALTRYNLGIFYQEHDEPEKAIQVYNDLLKVDPAFANANYNLGYLEIEMNQDYSKALPHFEAAARNNPNYAAAVYMQGVCMEKTGKPAAAADLYTKALKIDPRFELAQEGLKRLGK
ncbi:MAG: tetratricopeptide repeat protein [Bacteroidia bacterium]